jgi:hypothetical protein
MVNHVGVRRLPSDEVWHEVLGRIAITVREDHYLNGNLPRLDWWRTLQGGLAIEWQDGPYAHEVGQRLLHLGAAREECNDALYGRVGPEYRLGEFTSHFDLSGVPVSFRALDPIGHQATQDRVWRDLRLGLPTRNTAA